MFILVKSFFFFLNFVDTGNARKPSKISYLIVKSHGKIEISDFFFPIFFWQLNLGAGFISCFSLDKFPAQYWMGQILFFSFLIHSKFDKLLNNNYYIFLISSLFSVRGTIFQQQQNFTVRIYIHTNTRIFNQLENSWIAFILNACNNRTICGSYRFFKNDSILTMLNWSLSFRWINFRLGRTK